MNSSFSSAKAKLKAALVAERQVKECTYCYMLQAQIEKHVRESKVRANLISVTRHIASCPTCRPLNLQIITHAKEGHQ